MEVRSERTDGPLVSLAKHCMICALQIPLGRNCTEPCGGEMNRRVNAQAVENLLGVVRELVSTPGEGQGDS